MPDINFTPKFDTKIEVTTSGEGAIKSISLNGKPIPPDENGNVDLGLFYTIHGTYEGSIYRNTSGNIGISETVEESAEDVFKALEDGKILYFDLLHDESGKAITTRFSCSMHTHGIFSDDGVDYCADGIIFNGKEGCLVTLSVWILRSLEGEFIEFNTSISVKEI